MTNVSSANTSKAPQRAHVQITRSHNLAVRTNLRAGLAWDDLDDKAAEWWKSLTGAVKNAVSSVTNSTTSTTPQ